ncbi:MAG: glucan biosynthesis protein G [Pseudomonadota bacterium]
MNRRLFLSTVATLAAITALPPSVSASSYDVVSLLDVARAGRLTPNAASQTPLSAPFADLDYNAFRGIRPIEGKAAMLPHGPKFAYDLLPPGLYFEDIVTVDQVTSDGVRQIPFNPGLFSFEPRYFDEVPEVSPGAGFTGFRLRYPINSPDRMDEVLVMQGASYFRAIGQAMAYGLSARAVAIGTGGSGPEEFPKFTHIRIHPANGDAVRVEALIDSPSLTGHLDMRLVPGADTAMEITTTLFPRVDISDIGIAPLTSMYLKGPMLAAVSDDFRPRVHDSDVLAIENGVGETLWRPIANPAAVETSAFEDNSPKRFGLYQTPRTYADFQDTEARYHDRPSAYVEPLKDWGRGSVMLVELPTGDEFLDNIVTFWRPEEPLRGGGEYRFSYRLTWTRDAPETGHLPHIMQSRSGREHDRPGHRRYVIDVALAERDLDVLISTSDGAEIHGVSSFVLPDGSGTRVTFLLAPGETNSAEMRMSLRASDGTPKSPVWLSRWTRARDGGV